MFFGPRENPKNGFKLGRKDAGKGGGGDGEKRGGREAKVGKRTANPVRPLRSGFTV